MTSVPKAILLALGYTPQTLAADMGCTVSKARRILRPGSKIRVDEMEKIHELTEIPRDTLWGMLEPGRAIQRREELHANTRKSIEYVRRKEEEERKAKEVARRVIPITQAKQYNKNCCKDTEKGVTM